MKWGIALWNVYLQYASVSYRATSKSCSWCFMPYTGEWIYKHVIVMLLVTGDREGLCSRGHRFLPSVILILLLQRIALLEKDAVPEVISSYPVSFWYRCYRGLLWLRGTLFPRSSVPTHCHFDIIVTGDCSDREGLCSQGHRFLRGVIMISLL